MPYFKNSTQNKSLINHQQLRSSRKVFFGSDRLVVIDTCGVSVRQAFAVSFLVKIKIFGTWKVFKIMESLRDGEGGYKR